MPLVVMPAGLTAATSGAAYAQMLSATGTGPFSWNGATVTTNQSNQHPSNSLSISTTSGEISGTPFYTGNEPIEISVSRPDGAAADILAELSIGGSGSTQSITNSPPAATQGQSYNYQVQTTWSYSGSNQGCLPGLVWVFGSIPPGLSFNPLNTTSGTLFGTPTFAGTYTMTLMADGGSGCAPEPTNYKTLTLTIAPAVAPATPAGSSNWLRQSSSAVLQPSVAGWDSFLLGAPSVIVVGSTYYMYYEGLSASTLQHAIGLATSTDGIHWTKQTNPVLQGTAGGWDAAEIRYPSVVKNGATFLMVYQGEGSSGTALGLATSTDGIAWTKHSGPVVTSVGVHSNYTPASVLYTSGQYVMFYTVDGYIGRMTSADGIAWNDSGAVFSPSNSSVTFSRPSVLFDGVKYRMWYTRIADANDGTAATSGLYSVMIGYGDSPNGVTWTTYGNPIFTAGASGAWDRPGVGDPSVVYDGNTFRMWYVGGRENLPGRNPDSDTFVEGSIGYAMIP